MKSLHLIFFIFSITSLACSQSLPPNSKEGWNMQNRQEGIDDCIKNAVKMRERSPELAAKFCECLSDKMIQVLTFKESQDLMASSQEEQMKIIQPIIESCLAEVQKQETAAQLQQSNLATKDTLINFENSLVVNVPSGLKWAILDRNGVKSFSINQQMSFGNVMLMIVIFDEIPFEELKSQMIGFYTKNIEPKYNFSNEKSEGCPTASCANYDLDMIINGVSAKGKMYFFGKDKKYFNAYFITTGEPTKETIEQLRLIIETLEIL